ncbi:peptidoglycan-associated lipoprotein Pal [Serratia microhaemolytica]|uniref:peptidoglycan-associated lipoprotein Pal n=1 Tax=Serratia microhaemolytica TaxID=2675110 RepID=UPI003B830B3C
MMKNVVSKSIVLTLPLFLAVACSSNTARTGSSSVDSSASNGATGSGASGYPTPQLSIAEQARLQREELQRNNTVYFAFDKYDISPEFAQLLDAHATFLRSNPTYKVKIEGHADERGTPEYNIALGELRANAVQMYLQGKGVLAEQITIVSFGKEKPAVLGHDETAWSKNRRAVLVY